MRTETVVCGTCGGPATRGDAACPWCGAGLLAPRAPAAGGLPALATPVRKTFCPQCARLYGDDDAACPRCVAPDAPPAAEPFWGATASREGPAPRCPACAGTLAPERMGDVVADRCEACGGRWFDAGEVARVVDLSTWGVAADRVERFERESRGRVPGKDPRRGRACVRCRARTFRRLVAPRGPVHVDVCARHGLWFDDGELEAFRAFAAAGGLEIARHRADDPPPIRRRVDLISDPPPRSGRAPTSLLEVLGAILVRR
jgi:Zn-finger nucleic acid-binding protein